MTLSNQTIATMKASGIDFPVSVRAPGGSRTFVLNAEDVPAFVADRDQWTASHLGVSRQQYLDWVATDGAPRCGARTAKGTRCKLSVRGGGQRPIAEWVELDGGYCPIHGGD